jgi:hypothetical protein
MTVFQALALAFLGAVLAWELVRASRGAFFGSARLLRCAVWLAAAAAIAQPDLVTRIAQAIGIGRGADVVLYVFVLAFLATSFYWYSRHVLIQRQLTEVVRHLAIREARRDGNPAVTPGPPSGHA